MVRRAAQGVALAAVAGLLALLVWDFAHKNDATGFVDQIAAGDRPQAPGFSLSRLDGHGGKVTLASLRGKTVVVNFWASWCPPCKREAPLFARAYEKWRSHGVVFVGIDAQDLTSDARSFVRKYGIEYVNLRDHDESTFGHWGVAALPETYVIDAEGRAVDHTAGAIASGADLDAAIQAARE